MTRNDHCLVLFLYENFAEEYKQNKQTNPASNGKNISPMMMHMLVDIYNIRFAFIPSIFLLWGRKGSRFLG